MTREHPSDLLPASRAPVSYLPAGGGLPGGLIAPQPMPAVLDVVAVVSNPFRYHARWTLYREFERRVLASGARLTTVELAYGERPFEVTQPGMSFTCHNAVGMLQHVQLRTAHELWHKECLINVGISRLPRDWRYVAWIDADVAFARPDWVQETLHQLQHYHVVQLFSHYLNLKSDYGPLGAPRKSLMAAWQDGDDFEAASPYGSGPLSFVGAHPGFAWAARRDAIETLGGLFDTAILGAGDTHMAYAFLGDVDRLRPPDLSDPYRRNLEIWAQRAAALKGNFGVMPGLLLHYWHGQLADRRYHSRWKILLEWGYDPDQDLKRDWQGVYQLTSARGAQSIGLRDGIRRYFMARAEDHPGELDAE